ncbi:MAG: type I DNA topoisomerase [Oscillospiraceae bacterium]|nr:type I DNA topoisomerase [Oscillospiraceae bacterium]
MSKLVIVESPAKANTIKKYLGKDYDVVASKGHIRDLPAAKLSVDVKNNFAPKYALIKGKEKLVKELKEKVEQSDAVYLAADPDREGEAISWHLASVLGLDLNQPNRVTFNEITKTGVANGMANPKRVNLDLVNAQQARRVLDRLVGYRLSPFVSQKIRRGLSAGRVQSVAVRLIVDREEEIKAFNPEEYWVIDAKLATAQRRTFTATLSSDENGKVKISDAAQAQKYLDRLDGAEYEVKSVKKGTRKKNPAPPFITSTLQQEASRKLGFQAERTMRTAQELYEGVNVKGMGMTGLITYMRTDSLRISEEARAAANEYITNVFGSEYLPEKPVYYKSRANAQDGHEAIRPSIPSLSPEKVKDSLTSDQFKIYNLIWKRFIASLMASCVQNTVKAEITAAKDLNGSEYCIFTAAGYSVRFDGFTKLYELAEEETDKGVLPDIKAGEKLKMRELNSNQHFTQPPARYTEASLIKELEENGVGRPSTYAAILSTIIKRGYVQRKAKQLVPTELGTATTGLLKEKFPKIVNTKFTAQMETNLDKVGSGEEDYVRMLDEFYGDFEKTLEKAKTEMKNVKIQLEEDITDIPCDKCGRMMVIKTGRYGRFLACPGYPECKNAKPLIVNTGAKCPVCGGDIIERKSKKGHVFYGCGNWPKCNFMSWDPPAGEACPKCGKTLFKKKGGKLVCMAEGCGYEKSASGKKKSNGEG